MLKLIFDVKCGFETNYVDLKDYELDISFLAKRSFYNKLAILTNQQTTQTIIPTEEDLFLQYSTNVETFIKEYGLNTVLLSVVAAEIAEKHFLEALDKVSSPIIFPELFVVKNFKLSLTAEEAKLDNSTDVLKTLFDTEEATKEEDDDINHCDA